MDLLGDSIEKIAVEKAGIIKKKVPVIISETQPETNIIFTEKAHESYSPLFFADSIFSCNLGTNADDGSSRNYQITDLLTSQRFTGEIFLGGDYQSKNIQAVFTSFKALRDIFDVSEKNITDGIRRVIINTGLKGRWQILTTKPLTICDTGHNKEGLAYVMAQIRRIPKSSLHIVLGFVNDKDLGSVLPLFPADAFYYFTKALVSRALNEVILQSEAKKYGLNGMSFPDVKSALKEARKNAAETDLIFIGGSTFVVAEVV